MHKKHATIEQVDDDEVKLAEIFKHPIGIIYLYIQIMLGLILTIGLAYFLLPPVLGDVDTALNIANGFAAIAVIFSFMIVLVGTYIYRQNRLTITDRNITQILQSGLFNRKTSQLNINNVEDVTALQKGFLPTIFNYGHLNIETAGEQVNFHFTFCPNPGYYAKIILDAREKMLGQMDEDEMQMNHHHDHYEKDDKQSDGASSKPDQVMEPDTSNTEELLRTSADDSPETLKGIGAEMLRQAKKNSKEP